MVFACWALLSEAHALLLGLAAADGRGLALPEWLANAPVVGPWLAARWQSQLARPGALLLLTQHADPAALLGWAQSLGQFTARHALIVAFAILLLAFLYLEGASLGRELTRGLREAVGDRAEHYVDVATRAVRASVNSMLVVGSVQRPRDRAGVRDRRCTARAALGRDHRVAGRRAVPGLRGGGRDGGATGAEWRAHDGAVVAAAGLRGPACAATSWCGPWWRAAGCGCRSSGC